jgi:hypothetical protein
MRLAPLLVAAAGGFGLASGAARGVDGRETARQAHDHARATYRRLLAESPEE